MTMIDTDYLIVGAGAAGMAGHMVATQSCDCSGGVGQAYD
jgi:hypothetical protein